MLTNSQKEHLTYTAIGQVVTLIALGIWGMTYVIPGFSKIDTALSDANAAVESYTNTETNGLTFDEMVSLIGSRTEYGELLKIMNSDIEWTRNTIAKTSGTEKYLDWLKKSIAESSTDREVLSQQKKILNSIIPTVSPISGNIEEENIDLRGYIRFVESKILKQFNFESNMTLGLEWIASAPDMPPNIGSIDLQIAFGGKNKDITAFINYVNSAGNPELLEKVGTNLTDLLPTEKIPKIMENPLIVMTSFSLEKAIDEKSPEEENSGRATIRLFIRGISTDDAKYLSENLRTREDELTKKIEQSMEECTNKWALCGETDKRLKAFAKKFQEYKVSVGDPAQAGTIYMLAQKAKVLKSLETEFGKIIIEK
jgi:hypothetical protein